MAILEARNLTKVFSIGDRSITVLSDVTLDVDDGEFLVVKGNSGSGKTTLLSLLSGLDRPSAGMVRLDDSVITDASEDALARMRNETIGFVFQSFHLVPSLTAMENITFPAELKGDPQAVEKAGSLLARVGMSDRSDHFPHQLSGGEKQRIAICRSLINGPKLIFADEPTGNLDSENGRAILEMLLAFQKERQTTLVLVTHSRHIAERADRIVTLSDGRIVSEQRHDA